MPQITTNLSDLKQFIIISHGSVNWVGTVGPLFLEISGQMAGDAGCWLVQALTGTSLYNLGFSNMEIGFPGEALQR